MLSTSLFTPFATLMKLLIHHQTKHHEHESYKSISQFMVTPTVFVKLVSNGVSNFWAGLKQGRVNYIFWSEIEYGFQEARNTSPPNFYGSQPHQAHPFPPGLLLFFSFLNAPIHKKDFNQVSPYVRVFMLIKVPKRILSIYFFLPC